MRPGEVGTLLDGLNDEKLRYVAYRAIESQRERLRAGRDQWASLDTYALLETAKMDMNADYQPLRGGEVALRVGQLREHGAGLVSSMMDGPYADTVVSWIADFQRQGRPMMEGRLDRHDLAALQKYAMARLPETRSLLRFTFEQDQRPGQVAGFLSRDWSEKQAHGDHAPVVQRGGVESPRSRRRPDGARAECGPGDPRPAQAVDRPAHSARGHSLEDLV